MKIIIGIVYFLIIVISFDNKVIQRNVNKDVQKKEKPIFKIYKFNAMPSKSGKFEEEKFIINNNNTVYDFDNKTTWKLSNQELNEFFRKIDELGFFDDNKLPRREIVGPDASFIVVEAEYNGVKKRILSWHPIYENEKIVSNGSGGLTVIGNGSREDIIKSWPNEYRTFREIWSKLFEIVENLRIKNKK